MDEFLDGGVLSQGITEIAGESAAGKTQICMQLCLTVQLPQESGGLHGGRLNLNYVHYKNTEGSVDLMWQWILFTVYKALEQSAWLRGTCSST